MKHLALLSLTLMLCLLTTGVDAKTYVKASGDVYHTRTIEKTFKITVIGAILFGLAALFIIMRTRMG